MNLTLYEAKERVTIGALWLEFGYPVGPGKSSKCPFHEDKSPSFSVFDEGRKWKCFAGCGEGDVIDFLAKAKNLSNEEACKEILRRAGANLNLHRGGIISETRRIAASSIKGILQSHRASRGRKPRAQYRRGGVCLHWMKTLLFAKVCEHPSWILTDASQRCAEARRIDRKPYPATGTLGERKSHTLGGSSKIWPVGIFPLFEEPWLKSIAIRFFSSKAGRTTSPLANLSPLRTRTSFLSRCLARAKAFARTRYRTSQSARNRRRASRRSGPGGHRTMGQTNSRGRGTGRILQLKKGDLCDIVAAGATHNDLRLF